MLDNEEITTGGITILQKLSLFFFLFFFLLAPYLAIPVIGNTGMLSLAIFILLNVKGFFEVFSKRFFMNLIIAALLFSGYVLLLGLLFNGDAPLYVFKVLLSVIGYLCVGVILYQMFVRNPTKKKNGSDFVIWLFKISLLIIVLNSLIILITQLNPALKNTIESYLQKASNIDYDTHEWRARGLASAGGASLSIFHSIGIVLAFSLALNKRISYLIMILSVFLIFCSLIFIGRSGLIFAIIGVVVSIVINAKRFSLFNFLMIAMIISVVVYSLLLVLQDNVAASILDYNLFNTFDYNELKNDEGLLFFINKHFEIPTNPFTLLFGVGSFESVNDLNLYSDSGYMRILYYFGIPVGFLFFICMFFILKVPTKKKEISPIYLPILIILLAANIKEPVLYTGYSARMVFVISGFLIATRYFSKRSIAHTITIDNG